MSDEQEPPHDGETPNDKPAQIVNLESERKKRKPRGKRLALPPLGGWPLWYEHLRREERGRVIPDLRNLMIALRTELQLIGGGGFDEMLQQPMVLRTWPQAPDAEPVQPVPHAVGDDDVSRMQEWLQAYGMPRVGREMVMQAIELWVNEHRYHPVRDWLHQRLWDAQDRLNVLLHRALGTPDDEYHRQVGRKFIISMVARILQPGCKADYMLVLEGPQGEEKSKFCRALAGDYFSEHLPSIDKDEVRASMHLRGKWLIEVSELAPMLRADPEGTKSFITRQNEIYVPKHGRYEVHEPRQCVFAGTTNDDDYIRDTSGGRRFWPVRVAKVDLQWLNDNREQLFAEALERYQHGETWWPEREFEKSVIMPLQDERQFQDALVEPVSEYVELLTSVSMLEICKHLEPLIGRPGMAEQKRIAAILKHLRWRKGAEQGRNVWRCPPK